jgi:ribonuclease P protein component
MRKINTIKKNDEFLKVIKNGKYIKENCFTIYYIDNKDDNYYRFGISIGKKVGKAFLRNKIKRRLREIINKYKSLYKNGEEYIIIIKKEINELSFLEIDGLFLNDINKLKGNKNV